LAIGNERAFTMIEIAICLAIIGFALVAIIGVLPLGMHTQRDTREETIINQDATVLLEVIRGAARGADNLTNNVYAITNYWFWTNYVAKTWAAGVSGYDYQNSSTVVGTPYSPSYPINSGSNIVSLLSTPEFTDGNGVPIRKLDPAFVGNGYSNHVVAYVRSFSGLAAEKPPQAPDSIMVQDSFTYRVYCVNAPMAFDVPLLWSPQNYNAGDLVTYPLYGPPTYWRAVATGTPPTPPSSADEPTKSSKWGQITYYPHVLAANQRELRLTFLWPQLPNGNVGAGRQTFRATIAGQLAQDSTNNSLYFYQSQSFTNAP
jgi:type II secretory pathway pseudopilin PulG